VADVTCSGGPGHGHDGTDGPVVVLGRYRPGLTGAVAHTVHVLPHLRGHQPGVTSALCGALLAIEQIEIVAPGQGMPCTMCLLLCSSSASELPPAPPGELPADGTGAASAPITAAAGYRAWGWPATLRREQVSLSLDRQMAALLIPTALAAEVVAILAARRCPAPVLAHPYAQEHRVVLTGESYGLPLPWPPEVQVARGTLPLPPTVTPRGPVTWIHQPGANALRLCREIDVFAAVRTALRAAP